MASQCKDVDQGCYGLIQDLKQRGMFDDTLVIWGGEFGRTIYCQGKLEEKDMGGIIIRDVYCLDGWRRRETGVCLWKDG